MFNDLNWSSCIEKDIFRAIPDNREEKAAITKLKDKIADHFGGLTKFRRGYSGAYLIKPSTDQTDYTAAEQECIADVLWKAEAENEISSAYLYSIIFVAEYDVRQKTCVNFFPVDISLVLKINEMAELFDNYNVICLL